MAPITNLFYTDKTLILFTSQHHPEPKSQATRDSGSCLGTQQAFGKLKLNCV